MLRYLLLSGLAVAISMSAPTVAAQSAHVHGEGQINIAIDGNRIFMALESPGADIVGFEYEARSSDEKTAVTRAIAQLSDPMLLVRFEANAGCAVRQANAGIEGEHDEHEEDEHAGHDEHDDEGHEQHDEHKGEEAHGAFVAQYEFECTNIGALGSIEFTYFSQFSNAQSLDIVLIDSRGQRRVEIDRANPVLQLNN